MAERKSSFCASGKIETGLSKELLRQTTDLTSFLTRTISKAIAAAIDQAAIQGDGLVGSPLGILNTSGVNSYTFSGSPTLAKVLAIRQTLEEHNASNISFVARPAIKSKWAATARFSNGGTSLWDDGDNVLGNRGYATMNAPSSLQLVAGDFSALSIGFFGGAVSIIIDPFSLASPRRTRIAIEVLADVAVLKPTSFLVSSDSAAQ